MLEPIGEWNVNLFVPLQTCLSPLRSVFTSESNNSVNFVWHLAVGEYDVIILAGNLKSKCSLTQRCFITL